MTEKLVINENRKQSGAKKGSLWSFITAHDLGRNSVFY